MIFLALAEIFPHILVGVFHLFCLWKAIEGFK
jgi:hypothetical protein